MFYGDSIQAKTDSLFKKNVSNFINKQVIEDIPVIEVLRTEGSLPNLYLVIKNVGTRKAYNVQLLFSDKSTPSAFVANPISVANEVPKTVEYKLPMNLFQGIEMLLKVSNNDEDYKKNLITYMEKYNKGEGVLIPRFNIKYSDGNEEFISDVYHLVINQNKILYFGKEN